MAHDYFLFLLISSAPMALPLLVLTLGLLMLRRFRAQRRARMMDAENHITGDTTSSWEAANGPATLSGLPEPRSFENSRRSGDEAA